MKNKLNYGNPLVYDIETTVLNKYRDERMGEVYAITVREILQDKLNQEIEELSNGKKVNLNDGNFLK